jgi:hypothetical protein
LARVRPDLPATKIKPVLVRLNLYSQTKIIESLDFPDDLIVLKISTNVLKLRPFVHRARNVSTQSAATRATVASVKRSLATAAKVKYLLYSIFILLKFRLLNEIFLN